jgi:Domain of unknown function (DUF5664)
MTANAQPPQPKSADVGDVTSSARGSGARYNAGKMRVDLLPLRVLHHYHASMLTPPTPGRNQALNCLLMLAEWQERGDVEDLYLALAAMPGGWEDCCAVFDYGQKKYAAFNWCKGMQWSIPLACAVRHLLKIIENQQAKDDESGLPHVGHIYCNLCMLITYHITYTEGDDRPRSLLSGGLQ